jgi:hypothetical protein
MTESKSLTLVWRNPAPQRESSYAQTWVLHSQSGRITKVHVVFDSGSPRVAKKSAA